MIRFHLDIQVNIFIIELLYYCGVGCFLFFIIFYLMHYYVLSPISYSHRGYIYLIKKTLKTVIL